MTDPASNDSELTTHLTQVRNILTGHINFDIAPSRFNTDETRGQCRSASRRLVKILTGLACQCGVGFSDTNLPVIAYCGHYVCSKHEKEKSFRCGSCKEKGDPDKKLFLQDAVLEDFYKAIKQPGFRCWKCGEWHPRQNAVHCKEGIKVDANPFMCVWCASTGKNFEKYGVQSIDPSIPEEKGESLKSLDRTYNSAGWALNTCCRCGKRLYNPADPDPSIVHLTTLARKCNHIGHEKCEGIEGFECKWCIMRYTEKEVRERRSHAKDYLKTLGKDEEYYSCLYKCHQSHPHSNIIHDGESKICVWCDLERKEQRRLDGLNKQMSPNDNKRRCTIE